MTKLKDLLLVCCRVCTFNAGCRCHMHGCDSVGQARNRCFTTCKGLAVLTMAKEEHVLRGLTALRWDRSLPIDWSNGTVQTDGVRVLKPTMLRLSGTRIVRFLSLEYPRPRSFASSSSPPCVASSAECNCQETSRKLKSPFQSPAI